MAHDAFISYSTVDKAMADATCATLESAGIRCWIAPRDITPGLEYGGAIVRAIDQCRVLILIFSSHANNSRQIPREVERAINRGVPVVPVRVENVSPTDSLAYYMESVHWLDALTPPIESHLQRLAESIKALLDVPPASQKDPAEPDAPPQATAKAPQREAIAAGVQPKGGTAAKPAVKRAPVSLKFAIWISIVINVGLAILAALFQRFPDFVVILAVIGASYWLIFRNLDAEAAAAKFAALVCAAVIAFFVLENVETNLLPNWILAGIETISMGCLLYVGLRLPARASLSAG
jgi:hypothetical protein